MYKGLLYAHSGLRWLALLSLLFAIVLAFYGWLNKKEWKETDKLAGLLLMMLVDLQFLVGLILYVFVSPITRLAFKDFGTAMQNEALRFYAVEHVLMMVVALALVHIGRARTKKDSAGTKRHRAAAVYYTLSFLIILMAVPWSRGMF